MCNASFSSLLPTNYRSRHSHHRGASSCAYLSCGCGSTCHSGIHSIAMPQVEKEDHCPCGWDPGPRCVSPTIAHHLTVAHTVCSPAGECSKGQLSFNRSHPLCDSLLSTLLHCSIIPKLIHSTGKWSQLVCCPSCLQVVQLQLPLSRMDHNRKPRHQLVHSESCEVSSLGGVIRPPSFISHTVLLHLAPCHGKLLGTQNATKNI